MTEAETLEHQKDHKIFITGTANIQILPLPNIAAESE